MFSKYFLFVLGKKQGGIILHMNVEVLFIISIIKEDFNHLCGWWRNNVS